MRGAASDKCVQILCAFIVLVLLLCVVLAAIGADQGRMNVPDEVRSNNRWNWNWKGGCVQQDQFQVHDFSLQADSEQTRRRRWIGSSRYWARPPHQRGKHRWSDPLMLTRDSPFRMFTLLRCCWSTSISRGEYIRDRSPACSWKMHCNSCSSRVLDNYNERWDEATIKDFLLLHGWRFLFSY